MPQEASWSGTPSIKGSSEPLRMALLTFSLIGLQFTWGIEMTYCTPYLLQLGLTKSHTSAVWIAGPLSGLIMQPLVGVISDNSRFKWGRRRPFMIGGSVVVAICLFVLGWAKELVGIFVTNKETKDFWTIVLAVVSIYAVDFAINVVQSCCRSLIVDTLPIAKQQRGSAWASRMSAIGHLIGYGIGTLNLRSIWGDLLGDTQFKQLCIIAGFALIGACGVTSYAVQERILISSKDSNKSEGVWSIVRNIFVTALHLPNRIQAICWIQFWAWIGWFPFLFYSPTWVGEIYSRYSAPEEFQKSTDKLGEIGRIGSMSLVIFSLVTFAGSILLPFVVHSPDKDDRNFTPRPPPMLAKCLTFIHENKPDLLTAWLISHFIFAGTMVFTPFAHSLGMATLLVSLSGIPWAIACWAPFAFMGVEINRLSAPTTTLGNGSAYERVDTDDSPPSSPVLLHVNHNLPGNDEEDQSANSSTGELAGVYLGILNLFTTLPQFVGTFISMIVFSIVEPGKSREFGEEPDSDTKDKKYGVNAISVCLFIGALSALGAAYATRRLKFVR